VARIEANLKQRIWRPSASAPVTFCLLAAAIVCESAVPGIGAESLPTALNQLEKMRWDHKFPPYDEAEQRSAGLLKQFIKPEEQGQILFELVQIYGQTGGPKEKIVEHAQAALKLPHEMPQRIRLYIYLGEAMLRLHPDDPLPERRKLAAPVFFDALEEIRKSGILEEEDGPKAEGGNQESAVRNQESVPIAPGSAGGPTPLGTERAGALTPALSQMERELGRRLSEKERELALAKQAEREEQALQKARMLKQVKQQYDRLNKIITEHYGLRPYATEELRKLAMEKTHDPKLVDKMVSVVEEKVKTDTAKFGPVRPDFQLWKDEGGRKWLIIVNSVVVAALLTCVLVQRWKARRAAPTNSPGHVVKQA
jgi:hypothetical protein